MNFTFFKNQSVIANIATCFLVVSPVSVMACDLYSMNNLKFICQDWSADNQVISSSMSDMEIPHYSTHEIQYLVAMNIIPVPVVIDGVGQVVTWQMSAVLSAVEGMGFVQLNLRGSFSTSEIIREQTAQHSIDEPCEREFASSTDLERSIYHEGLRYIVRRENYIDMGSEYVGTRYHHHIRCSVATLAND